MTFQICALAPQQFAHLLSVNDAELAAQGIDRHIADEALSFPCRVSLEDAAIGEELLLLNFAHLKTTSTYQGPHFCASSCASSANFCR